MIEAWARAKRSYTALCCSVRTTGDILLGSTSKAHGPHARALNHLPGSAALSTSASVGRIGLSV